MKNLMTEVCASDHHGEALETLMLGNSNDIFLGVGIRMGDRD